MFEANVFGCLPLSGSVRTTLYKIRDSTVTSYPVPLSYKYDGKQPETFGSNILIFNHFLTFLAMYIEYIENMKFRQLVDWCFLLSS